jgi:PhnB protein
VLGEHSTILYNEMSNRKGIHIMVSPVIHFNGNCNEAIGFYEQTFGATDKYISYFRDAPSDSGFSVTEDTKDLVMHAGMTICGTHFNFSDSQEKIIAGNMLCLNVFFKTSDEVCGAYDKLKEGGKIIVELGPQFFSNMYGSIEDRFGVKWQLIAES